MDHSKGGIILCIDNTILAIGVVKCKRVECLHTHYMSLSQSIHEKYSFVVVYAFRVVGRNPRLRLTTNIFMYFIHFIKPR